MKNLTSLSACVFSVILSISAFAVPGGLDATFGSNGTVSTFIGASDAIGQGMVIQADGKIVVAGYSIIDGLFGTNNDFTLTRYNANGSLDVTFNGAGKVTTAIGGGSDYANSVAMQVDGKIVVAGSTANGNGGYNFALARYNTNGSLDTTFNGTGKVVTTGIGSGGDNKAYSVAVQSDGKILAAGYSLNGNYNFALVRYNANGSLDTSFNSSGKVITAIGSSDSYGRSVALQKDGKILVAGYSSNGTNDDFALVRYNTDGSLDGTFNGTGKVTTAVSGGTDQAFSVVVQPDGKIIAVGNAYSPASFNQDFAVVRYNSNGSLDSTFNGTGKVLTDIRQYSGGFYYATNDHARSVALQGDGKIVVAGDNGGGYNFAVARYNPDGSLDTTFNGTGQLTTDFNGGAGGTGIALQADGKIVVAGYSDNTGLNHFVLARYQTGPVVPQLYVGSQGGAGQVGIYNPSTGAAINAVFASEIVPYGLLLSGNTLYVADSVSRVTAYNINTGAVNTSFGNAGSITGVGFPQGLAISGNTLYVPDSENNTVTTYNATTGAALGLTINTGSGPSGIAVANNTLYVANTTGGRVVGYNATTGVPTGLSIAVTGPLGLAIQGSTLYVGSTAGTVTKYNASTGAAIPFTNPITGGVPRGIVVSGNRLYVAFQGSNSVTEFNTGTGAVNTSFGISGSIGLTGPSCLAITPTSPSSDVNGDGIPDLVFQNNAGQLYQWLLDGIGRAVTFSPKAGINNFGYLYGGGLGDWRVVAVRDVNGDGIPDLVFQNGAGQIYAWFLDGTGAPVNFGTGAGLVPGSKYLYTGGLADWRVAGIMDVNGDNIPDLVFQNNAGQLYAWFLNLSLIHISEPTRPY